MKKSMFAIVKKDFVAIVANRRMFPVLIIVPLVFTVLLPTLFVLTIHFAELNQSFTSLVKLLPKKVKLEDMELNLYNLIINYIMPTFFMLIPIMSASVMSANAFVGEKESHTLETLLYCPLTLKEIFQAKVWAPFAMSMLVTLISLVTFFTLLELELFFLVGELIIPSLSWALVIFLVSPATALIAITLIVKQSAKAKTIEESQQAAVFLLMPVILMLVAQFTGAFLINAWIMLGLGIVLAVLAVVLLRRSMGNFTYEKLLQ